MHMCVCACTCVCVRVCARAFVCVCVCVVLIPAVLCMSAGHKLSATQCVEGIASGLFEELFHPVACVFKHTHIPPHTIHAVHLHVRKRRKESDEKSEKKRGEQGEGVWL